MIFQWMCPIITIHNDCLQVIKEDDDRYDDIVSTRRYYGKFRDNHLAFSHRVSDPHQLRLLPIRWNAINKVTISSLSHPSTPIRTQPRNVTNCN